MSTKSSLQFLAETWRGEHDLESNDLYAVLLKEDFTFDPATHSTYSDISNDEISEGNGYTAGGQLLSSVSVDIDTDSETVTLNCDNVSWTASGGDIPAAGAVAVYNDTHPNKTVVCCYEFDDNYYIPDGTTGPVDCSNGLMVKS